MKPFPTTPPGRELRVKAGMQIWLCGRRQHGTEIYPYLNEIPEPAGFPTISVDPGGYSEAFTPRKFPPSLWLVSVYFNIIAPIVPTTF